MKVVKVQTHKIGAEMILRTGKEWVMMVVCGFLLQSQAMAVSNVNPAPVGGSLDQNHPTYVEHDAYHINITATPEGPVCEHTEVTLTATMTCDSGGNPPLNPMIILLHGTTSASETHPSAGVTVLTGVKGTAGGDGIWAYAGAMGDNITVINSDYIVLEVMKADMAPTEVNASHTGTTVTIPWASDTYLGVAGALWLSSPAAGPNGDGADVKFEPSGITSGQYTVKAWPYLFSTCAQCEDDCTLRVLEVINQTVATIPADRSRKKVGVGEDVTLTLQPSSLSSVNWSISGNGTLSATTGNPVTFTAYDQASAPTITATYGGVSCSVTFNVVAPSSAVLVKTGGSGQTNPLGVQMKADWYIGPEDVNFSKLYIAEQQCTANCTGYFTYQQGLVHNPGADLPVTTTLLAGSGWKCNGFDNISGGTQGSPYTNGIFTWSIPWHYKIGTNSYLFTTVDHVKSLSIGTDGKATLDLTKRGASQSQKEP